VRLGHLQDRVMCSNTSVSIDSTIRDVKLGKNPVHRLIRRVLKALLRPTAPRIPGFLKPPLRLFYELPTAVIVVARWLITVCYRLPLFQARCASFGKNVSIEGLPYIQGHVEIHVGDNVSLGGHVQIGSGRFLEHPRLILQDGSKIGWNVTISVNQEVVIEEGAVVSYNSRISDSDERVGEPGVRDIRPVRICRSAWVASGCQVMKGVTIGEGAVIGANSVVINDIPPYCLAMGNPAEVYFRNYGRPSKQAAAAAAPAAE